MAESTQVIGRRVLWIDPFFQARRPTTQSLYLALPALLDKGWLLELWCLEHDALDGRVKVLCLPRVRCLRMLEPLWFWFMAWFRLGWCRWFEQGWDIVHTSGPDIPGVDVMSLHFHNRTWIGMQWGEHVHSFKERLKLLHTVIGVIQETLALGSKKWQTILPVSEGLANRIRPQLTAEKKIQVLPNVLDESRFNLSVRVRERQAMRIQMHSKEQDFFFIFVSTGHYQRKGLWPAVQSLQACREVVREECGLSIHFLVVGAGESAQSELISRLTQDVPGWRDWVQLIPPTQEVERWYAAADAFLFPSRYETFSLVALEAAACGLPLLITPYDGHEMYLRDGVNGCLLPSDLDGMISRILRFILQERHEMKSGPAASISASGFAEVLDRTYRDVIRDRAL